MPKLRLLTKLTIQKYIIILAIELVGSLLIVMPLYYTGLNIYIVLAANLIFVVIASIKLTHSLGWAEVVSIYNVKSDEEKHKSIVTIRTNILHTMMIGDSRLADRLIKKPSSLVLLLVIHPDRAIVIKRSNKVVLEKIEINGKSSIPSNEYKVLMVHSSAKPLCSKYSLLDEPDGLAAIDNDTLEKAKLRLRVLGISESIGKEISKNKLIAICYIALNSGERDKIKVIR